MKARSYRVKEVAEMTSVTIRTLHYYDAIGLLVPSGRSEAGYRLYSVDDIERLHQILLWRELGFPLEKIRQILDDPGFDRKSALLAQRGELVERGRRVEAMVGSIDRALESYEGEEDMEARELSELFEGFDPTEYEDEVRERWGDTEAYKESARRTKRYTKQDWKRIKHEGDDILDALAQKMREGAKANDDDVVALAEKHRLHIDRWFYPCSREMHAGLGEMYVADDRFTTNIDKHGEGLAQFLRDAIRKNAERS